MTAAIPYSDDDDTMIVKLRNENLGYGAIGRALNRTTNSIASRVAKLIARGSVMSLRQRGHRKPKSWRGPPPQPVSVVIPEDPRLHYPGALELGIRPVKGLAGVTIPDVSFLRKSA